MALKYIVIGGSAGSFQVVTKILTSLPESFSLPIFLCLHRLKHVRSGFIEALSIKTNRLITEPLDKEEIKQNVVYLTPANYHMYVETEKYLSLSTEGPVNHSRPSIDLLFSSAAYALRNEVVGIILSGANKDGAFGLKEVKSFGGTTIVQEPKECQVDTMTKAALEATEADHVLNTDQIIEYLKNINK